MGECYLTPKGMAEVLLEKAGIDSLMEQRLDNIGYFRQPASKGHHLAEYGGLMRHSINVTQRLVTLTLTLGVSWPRKESPYLVGMLHDLVKCHCYKFKEEVDSKPQWEYTQPVYPGHGACSVAIASEIGIKLVKEEIVAITYHMGMYGVGREYTDKEFDNALRLHGPQVLATIYADWWAARVDEKEGAE
ncbi:MAG: hypothetical protein J6V72_04975 [Kiritimatiellae bacterium]|nr:hypothetical protein [Kiritimatiellia bacterium]